LELSLGGTSITALLHLISSLESSTITTQIIILGPSISGGSKAAKPEGFELEEKKK